MERKIYDYFDSEVMPQGCTERIENALSAQPRHFTRPRWVRAAAVAAVLILALGLLFTPRITTAFAEVYDYIVRPQNPQVDVPLGRVDMVGYVSYGGLTNGPVDVLIMVSPNADPICQVQDGRLYFVANGEHMDITDLCSEEEAFVYALVDDTGVIHYFIVGGEPETWGYQIFIFDPQKDSATGWVFGGGAGHVTATSGWEERPWVQDGREKVGHPW